MEGEATEGCTQQLCSPGSPCCAVAIARQGLPARLASSLPIAAPSPLYLSSDMQNTASSHHVLSEKHVVPSQRAFTLLVFHRHLWWTLLHPEGSLSPVGGLPSNAGVGPCLRTTGKVWVLLITVVLCLAKARPYPSESAWLLRAPGSFQKATQ